MTDYFQYPLLSDISTAAAPFFLIGAGEAANSKQAGAHKAPDTAANKILDQFRFLRNCPPTPPLS